MIPLEELNEKFGKDKEFGRDYLLEALETRKRREEIYEPTIIEKLQKAGDRFEKQFQDGFKRGYLETVKQGFGNYLKTSFNKKYEQLKNLKRAERVGYLEPDTYKRVSEWGDRIANEAATEIAQDKNLQAPSDIKPFFEGGMSDPGYYGSTIGQSLPYILSNLTIATAAGLSGPASASLAGSYVTGYMLEKGNAYKRYKEEGVSEENAEKLSDVYGHIAAGIENMMGVKPAGIAKKAIMNEGAEKVVYGSFKDFLMKELPRIGWSTLKDSAGEGGEEVIQSIAENLLLKFAKEETPVFSNNLKEEFMGGVIASIPFGVTNIRIPHIQKDTKQDIRQADKVREVINKTDKKISESKIDIEPLLKPLIKEAKKYDTFDEFLESNNKNPKFLFRGMTEGKVDRIEKISEELGRDVRLGRNTTSNLNNAIRYSQKGGFSREGQIFVLPYKEEFVETSRRHKTKDGSELWVRLNDKGYRAMTKVPNKSLNKLRAIPKQVEPEIKKYPENEYQKEILERVGEAKELPKMKGDAFKGTPNTFSHNNPYTRVMRNLWGKMVDFYDSNAPRALKESQTNEISQLLKEKRRIYDGIIDNFKEENLDRIKDLSTKEKQEIGKMIYGRIDVPAEYKNQLDNIHTKIGRLSMGIVGIDKELIKNGYMDKDMMLLTEEKALENIGEYARTMYVRENKKGERIIEPSSALTEDGVIDRSAFKRKLKDEEWGANALLLEGKTEKEVEQYSTKELKEIGQDAKERYGWTFQADYILAKTITDMTKSYATRQFQKTIVENPRLFSKEGKDGMIPVSNILPRGTEKDVRLGPLNDGYIHPGIEEELKTFVLGNGRDAVFDTMQSMLSTWKMFKVPLNLSTAFRNLFTGSTFQNDIAGFPVWTPQNSKEWITSVKNYWSRDNKYNKARDAGQFGSTYYDVEIEEGEMNRIIRKMEASKNPQKTFMEEVMKIAGDAGDKLQDFARYYNHIDHVNRMYLYNCIKRDGVVVDGEVREASDARAVHFANKWQLDYRFVPKLLSKIRESPASFIYPFLSFQTLIAPRIAEVMITRPWTLLKYPIIAGAVSTASAAALGSDEDEIEAAKPEYLQDNPYVVTLPWKNDQGEYQFLDFSYLFPIGKPKFGFLNVGDWIDTIKGRGATSGLTSVLNNFDPFTGRKVYNENASENDKRGQIIEYLGRFLAPGIIIDVMNIYDAATGKIEGYPMQKEKSLMEQVARSIGVPISSGGFNEAYWKIRTNQRAIETARTFIVKYNNNPNISLEEKREKIREYKDLIREKARKIEELQNNMPRQ